MVVRVVRMGIGGEDSWTELFRVEFCMSVWVGMVEVVVSSS